MNRKWRTELVRYRQSSTFIPGVIIGFCAGFALHAVLESLIDLVREPFESNVAETIEENVDRSVAEEPADTGDDVEKEAVEEGDSLTYEQNRRPVPDQIFRTPSGLVIPVEGVNPEDLYDSFDDERSEGRYHDAIDIPAAEGTPVLAATGGEILRFFRSELGGMTIYQRGDDRLIYYYAHLKGYAPEIREGMRVEAGDEIGSVGNSGNAGPDNYHLHFAIWTPMSEDSYWDGDPINPYPLLAGDRNAVPRSAE
jgi:murein DD-endopeptidase MepM/ murein hydrolase activator NlpD